MPFQLQSCRKQSLFALLSKQHLIKTKTRDGCGSTAAQSGTHWNVTADGNLERGEIPVFAGELMKGTLNAIVAAWAVRFEMELQFSAACIANSSDANSQVKLHGDSKGVEAGTEVRNRSRHHNFSAFQKLAPHHALASKAIASL